MLIIAVIFVLLFVITTILSCEVSCLKHWINYHRKDPLDIEVWKSKLCSFFKTSSCTTPTRIILMDKRNVSFDYIRSNEWSLDTNDSYTVLLVVDLMSLLKKDPNNIGDDGHLEYNAYTYDFLSKNYNIELLRALKSTEDNVRLCNFKNSSEYNAIHKIVLNRIPSIFSVHNIIDDTFIEKKMHYINLLLFANQEYDCSLLLHEVLICMTVFNFVQGTYTFSSENYHQNLSIFCKMTYMYLTMVSHMARTGCCSDYLYMFYTYT